MGKRKKANNSPGKRPLALGLAGQEERVSKKKRGGGCSCFGVLWMERKGGVSHARVLRPSRGQLKRLLGGFKKLKKKGAGGGSKGNPSCEMEEKAKEKERGRTWLGSKAT